MTANITIKDMKRFANKCNAELFDDVLDLKAIHWKASTRMTNTLGRFSVRGGLSYAVQTITISTLLFNDNKEWKTTLIHELVHAWQYQTGRKLDHGTSFKMKAQEIHRRFPEIIITRTRNSDYIDKAVASRQAEFGRKQFIIVDRLGRINFLRNIHGPELTLLRSKGYAVYQNNVVLNARHCKNVKALLQARYYYNATYGQQIDWENCRKLS